MKTEDAMKSSRRERILNQAALAAVYATGLMVVMLQLRSII